MKYAGIVSINDKYKKFLTAQLNSLHEQGIEFDLHIIAVEVGREYLEWLRNESWSFNVFIHERVLQDYESIFKNQTEGLYVKKSRYYELSKGLLDDYDVVLLLDADLMIVRDITPFFDMVANTDVILGCNEKHKWALSNYELDGEQLPAVQMLWMMCNAPLFFVPARQKEFLKEAHRVGVECKSIRKDKVPSDLFTMNISLWISGAYKNVIPLPNYAWTGVHNGYIGIYTRIFKKAGEWRSLAGEPVYMLHGRWDNDHTENYYYNEQHKRYNELRLPDEIRQKYDKLAGETFQQIKDEFQRLYNKGRKIQLNQ